MDADVRRKAMAQRCLRRIDAWRVPPNWSLRDWHEEMNAEAAAAAWEAELDFDPTRGVPLEAFVHQRVMARAWTRYRREWVYARRCGSHPESSHCTDVIDSGVRWMEVLESLRECLRRLPEPERKLIESLFWEGMTEVEVARLLSLSQPAINQRKRLILERLGREMGWADPEKKK
jgi:RNA polymerase sigma factor (sigma-70 family)